MILWTEKSRNELHRGLLGWYRWRGCEGSLSCIVLCFSGRAFRRLRWGSRELDRRCECMRIGGEWIEDLGDGNRFIRGRFSWGNGKFLGKIALLFCFGLSNLRGNFSGNGLKGNLCIFLCLCIELLSCNDHIIRINILLLTYLNPYQSNSYNDDPNSNFQANKHKFLPNSAFLQEYFKNIL